MLIVLLLALTTLGFGAGSTEIVDAKIASITNQGFLLQIGQRSIEVQQTSKTKFWRDRSPADPTAFKEGDLLTARISKTTPVQILEAADPQTWQWLTAIRSQPQIGTVVDVGPKDLTVQFSDGSRFTYRTSKKSKVTLSEQADANLSDLQPGQKVYVKGRASSSYDTSLVEVRDSPFRDTGKGRSKKASSSIAATGTLDGKIKTSWPQYRMFDISQEKKVLHISYTGQTKFTLDSKPTSAISLRSGLHAVISYRRGKFGRIVATRVELSAQMERMVRTGVGKRTSASLEELFSACIGTEIATFVRERH